MYCEEIDVGEEVPRQVVSGIREYYPISELEGRRVLVVCNLKEAKLQGVLSFGMVLASKNPGSGQPTLELVAPPGDAAVG